MTARNIFGAIIILIGLDLFLRAIGVTYIPSIDVLWPVILILIGLVSWRANPHMFAWPLLLVALGVIFLLENLNVLTENAWNYVWPAFIIVIGLQVLFHRQNNHMQDHVGTGERVSATFAGHNEKVQGTFTHGQVSATFGGAKYDLRDATIADAATLEVTALFGGVEILVPRDVNVHLRITPMLGGAENKAESNPGATKTLTITGTATFGGVDVKN